MHSFLLAKLLLPLTAAALLARGAISKFIEHDYKECPQVKSLHCKNGSTCAPGIASFGKQHDHLNLPTQDSGYYCRCPEGFIGHECTIRVDDCDKDKGTQSADPLQSCYHGSTCTAPRPGGDRSGYYCDCKKVNDSSSPTDTKFAGKMCQHESTSLCAVSLVGQHAPNHQFCTNHGSCIRMVKGGEPHPGCICRDGWMGEHCEIRKDPFAPMLQANAEEPAGGTNAGKELFALFVIPVIVMAALGIIMRKKDNPADVDLVVFRGVAKESQHHEQPLDGTEKKVLAEGDLEPDGSGTLGNTRQDINGDEDLELSIKDEFVVKTEVV